jgi:hypothetical protein
MPSSRLSESENAAPAKAEASALLVPAVAAPVPAVVVDVICTHVAPHAFVAAGMVVLSPRQSIRPPRSSCSALPEMRMRRVARAVSALARSWGPYDSNLSMHCETCKVAVIEPLFKHQHRHQFRIASILMSCPPAICNWATAFEETLRLPRA